MLVRLVCFLLPLFFLVVQGLFAGFLVALSGFSASDPSIFGHTHFGAKLDSVAVILHAIAAGAMAIQYDAHVGGRLGL